MIPFIWTGEARRTIRRKRSKHETVIWEISPAQENKDCGHDNLRWDQVSMNLIARTGTGQKYDCRKYFPWNVINGVVTHSSQLSCINYYFLTDCSRSPWPVIRAGHYLVFASIRGKLKGRNPQHSRKTLWQISFADPRTFVSAKGQYISVKKIAKCHVFVLTSVALMSLIMTYFLPAIGTEVNAYTTFWDKVDTAHPSIWRQLRH